MNARKIIFGSIVTSLAVATLVACGDDDKDAPAAISKADFLVQANAICATFDEKMDAAEVATTEEEAVDFVANVAVPELRSTLDQIRALGFPAGDEALLDGLIDETNVLLDTFEADPTALVNAPTDPFAETNAQLVEYGLTVCGD